MGMDLEPTHLVFVSPRYRSYLLVLLKFFSSQLSWSFRHNPFLLRQHPEPPLNSPLHHNPTFPSHSPHNYPFDNLTPPYDPSLAPTHIVR